ncbi:clpP, partial [Symbiodinium necroappetens]
EQAPAVPKEPEKAPDKAEPSKEPAKEAVKDPAKDAGAGKKTPAARTVNIDQ